MPDTPAFLVERLHAEGEKMSSYFASLTDEQWQVEIYSEGNAWTVRNVLAHLVTAERGFVTLFEQIRQGGQGAAQDFSIDRFNASQQRRTRDLPVQELLKQYRDVRREMAAWVSGLNPADLLKEGRHPFLGMTTLEEMIKMVYRHNQIHYRDLRKTLEGKPARDQ